MALYVSALCSICPRVEFYLLPCHSVTCTTSRTSDRETRVLLALLKRSTKHFGTLTYKAACVLYCRCVCTKYMYKYICGSRCGTAWIPAVEFCSFFIVCCVIPNVPDIAAALIMCAIDRKGCACAVCGVRLVHHTVHIVIWHTCVYFCAIMVGRKTPQRCRTWKI